MPILFCIVSFIVLICSENVTYRHKFKMFFFRYGSNAFSLLLYFICKMHVCCYSYVIHDLLVLVQLLFGVVFSNEDESRLLSNGCKCLCSVTMEEVIIHISSDVSHVKPMSRLYVTLKIF